MTTRIRKATSAMRKQPLQARSRATVAAVIEAGTQVLARGGWHALNTNVVAELAGVSIGTLYQYFPNKLALVAAMRRRHFADVLAALAVVEREDLPLDERVTTLVERLALAHHDAPALQRALLEEAPPIAEARHQDEAFERAYLAAFERLVAHGTRKPARAPLTAQLLASAVEGVVHDAARRGIVRSHALHAELSDALLSVLGAGS